MTKNMTTGSPFKLIMSFALPLLLGNLLQQTYNLIDAAIVGRFLGSDALASVGASSSVQFLVLGFCMGTACGFGVPIARHFGAGDIKKLKQYFYNSIGFRKINRVNAIIAKFLTILKLQPNRATLRSDLTQAVR